MLQRFLSRLIGHRHYWRNVGFDELSELYSSMMFRSLAQSLVGIFIPIYFYQLGYAVWEILLFYAMALSVHALAVFPAAKLIAKVGPKHTILASYVFQVMGMCMLVSQESLRWPLLAIASVMGISACLFFMAFHVDFSKVKHSEHGGKEVGWMYSMEKIGAILGPLVGGLVGYFAGGQYIFLVGIILLFVGIIPLFLTSEPTALNQKLDFNSLKIKLIKRDLIANSFFALENHISIIIWPMFVSIYIFRDNPYVQLGTIMSISVLVSVFIARAFGRTIDNNKGRQLLRIGAISNALIHLFRPFTAGYVSALGINLANEAATPAYRMPFIKGVYDAADQLPGRRIVYLAAMESVSAISRSLFFALAGLVAYFTQGSKSIFIVFFAVAAIASLGITLEKFKALEPVT